MSVLNLPFHQECRPYGASYRLFGICHLRDDQVIQESVLDSDSVAASQDVQEAVPVDLDEAPEAVKCFYRGILESLAWQKAEVKAFPDAVEEHCRP